MKKIPLSCADFTFPLLPHQDVCRLIAMLGLKGVDIGFFTERSHIRPEDIRGHESKVGGEIQQRLADLGLEASSVYFQPGANHAHRAVNHPENSQREEGWEMFQRALDFVVATGSRHMGGLPGMVFDHPDDLRIAAEESAKRALLAEQAGLSYAVEPHVGSIIPSPETTLEFLKLAPGVKINLDYGHFIYAGFSNDDIHTLLAHANHIHARGGAKGRLQVGMAKNEIDFPEIYRRLKSFAYPGWICLEYVWIDWEDCNLCDNISETILLRNLFQNL